MAKLVTLSSFDTGAIISEIKCSDKAVARYMTEAETIGLDIQVIDIPDNSIPLRGSFFASTRGLGFANIKSDKTGNGVWLELNIQGVTTRSWHPSNKSATKAYQAARIRVLRDAARVELDKRIRSNQNTTIKPHAMGVAVPLTGFRGFAAKVSRARRAGESSIPVVAVRGYGSFARFSYKATK